jgi:hypothetical protein
MRLDSCNYFGVGVQGDRIVLLHWPIQKGIQSPVMTRNEALVLAAWLAVLADPGREKFRRLVGPPEGTDMYGVVAEGERVVIAKFPAAGFEMLTPWMMKEAAIGLAAELAREADPGLARFNRLVEEIENS